jgi:hypothetical protein
VQRSAELVADLRAAGYRVVGDLDELMPRPPGQPGADQVSDDALLSAAAAAVAGLLLELEPMRQRLVRRREEPPR